MIGPTTWRDAYGVDHPAAGPAPRIVSLVPSLTELVIALGLGDRLVGRTHYCVHPAETVARIPSLGGTKKIKLARLDALAATHVLVNMDETPKPLYDQLVARGLRVMVTDPRGPDDNPPLYRLIGGVFGRAAAADALADRYRAARDRLVAAAAAWPARRVLYLIWRKPWMAVGPDTYIARLLHLARWQVVPAAPGGRYLEVGLSDDLIATLDLVLLASEPYRFTEGDADDLGRRLTGARPRIARIDGEMMSWYGARAIDGLGYLARFAAAVAAPAGTTPPVPFAEGDP